MSLIKFPSYSHKFSKQSKNCTQYNKNHSARRRGTRTRLHFSLQNVERFNNPNFKRRERSKRNLDSHLLHIKGKSNITKKKSYRQRINSASDDI